MSENSSYSITNKKCVYVLFNRTGLLIRIKIRGNQKIAGYSYSFAKNNISRVSSFRILKIY